MNMKNRKMVFASVIIVFLTGSFLYLCAVVAAESASVYITVDSNPTRIGDTFIANINVAGVEGLWGWTVDQMSWNPDVLKVTRVAKGQFLTSGGAADMFPAVFMDNAGGTFLSSPSQVLLERSSVSGGGVLARIYFEVIGEGSADITLNSVRLLDPTNAELPYAIDQIPRIAIPSGSSSSSSGSHGGAVIVVSTDKSSYLLGDLVSTFANVTFNGGGVAKCDVAFTLLYPNGTMAGSYVDTTNSSGLAGFTFRVPAPADLSVVFGEWSILASVDVSEVVITGTTTFTVESSLSIKSISIPSSIQRSDRVPINVTLEGEIPEGLVFTASISDSAQLPLGMSPVSLKAQTQGTTTITTVVLIPSWAFTGQAIAYVNILTAAPEKSGTPYCPQATLAFQIT
jgi:hypothetical protein